MQAGVGDDSQKCVDAAKAMNIPEHNARACSPTYVDF
jgi:hypothetical protein